MSFAMRSVANFAGLAWQSVRACIGLGMRSVTHSVQSKERVPVSPLVGGQVHPITVQFLPIALWTTLGVLLLVALLMAYSTFLATRVRNAVASAIVDFAQPRMRSVLDAAAQDALITRQFVKRLVGSIPPRSGADFIYTRHPIAYVRFLDHPDALEVVTFTMYKDTVAMEALMYVRIYLSRARVGLLRLAGWQTEAEAAMLEGAILCRALYEIRRVQIEAVTIASAGQKRRRAWKAHALKLKHS